MFKITILFFLLSSATANAQLLTAEKLSACLLNNCDAPALFKENRFEKVYGGPRKERGYIYLFHNSLKHEYIFLYLNAGSEIEEFAYYLPDKFTYRNFLKTKNDILQISGLGSVLYHDGKKYYQVAIRKRNNTDH